MFATVPVYNASLESEERIINPSHIEEIRPHADVPVDPGAVNTTCCEAFFFSGNSIVILIDYTTMKGHLQAITGEVDVYGVIT
jgi:hypothetical protein